MIKMQNLAFSLSMFLCLLFGCKKEDPERLSSVFPSLETPKTTFYFRGNINGVYKDWTVTDYNTSTNNGWGNSKYYFNAASAVGALGEACEGSFCKNLMEDVVIAEWNGPGLTKNYIAAGFYIASNTGDRSEIIRQFEAGEKSYGIPRKSISDPVRDGVYVYYIDENKKQWCSHWGAAEQSGSKFTSVELLPQPDPKISCLKRWKATFSCTLYDGLGNSIALKDGVIYSPVLVKK